MPAFPDHLMHMDAVVCAGVFEKLFKRKLAASKRDLGPGDFRFTEQSRFKALGASAKIAEEGRCKKHVDLPGLDDIDRCKQATNSYIGAGLFEGLAGGTLFHRLAELHEASRYRPVSVAWFDSAAAKQNLAILFGHTAHDDSWILVVNDVAPFADPAKTIVAVRYLLDDKVATI